MKQLRINTFILVACWAAGTSVTAQTLRLPDVVDTPLPLAAPPTESAANTSEPLRQPPEIGVVTNSPSPPAQVEQLPAGKGETLTLEQLEQMATTTNPAIAQASARVAALRGRFIQVGLPQNPTIGYAADDIGENNTAGKQGGFVGQEFSTGGKLRLNRAIVSQEIQQAEQVLEAVRLRVLTDVRLAYYAALVAERREGLANELLQIGAKTASESLRLKGIGEIAKTDLLPIEIEQRNAQIVLETAYTERAAAWRALSAVVGVDLPPSQLVGDVSQLPGLLNYDEQLSRVLTSSPEISAAIAEIARSEFALVRARREVIPNLSTEVSVQHDNSTGDTLTGVNVGIPVPVWNRNQGAVRQSEAQLVQARRNVNRVELNLKSRLAIAYQRYSSAQTRARIYSTEIVPRAEENFKLVQAAFPAQVGSLEFLQAQRTYFQTRLAYLDALAELWSSWSEIQGMLLLNSLNAVPDDRDR